MTTENVSEKIYCYDRPADNSALWAAVMSNKEKGATPLETMAMMNGGMGGGMWNNPFMYLIWMSMFNGGNGFGGFGGGNVQANEMMNQINSLRQQIGDNQLNSVALDAIRGNQNAINTLAQGLNADFNQVSTALCNLRSAIENVGGQVGFSAERVINAVGMGDATITSKLQECCCNMKTAVLEQGYQSQLATERQTNFLSKSIDDFRAMNQLQSCQNTNAITRSISDLAARLEARSCDVEKTNLANTQRILDTLNGHWQAETALALQDEKFKNSQLMQNQYIASLINGTTAAKASTAGA